jgi:CO/xanthine dehydrogenase FAD-binding subunit
MTFWKHYHLPHSVEEAVELLEAYDGQARVVGGGTDLILEMQGGHQPPVEALIDPTRIPGLDQIVSEAPYLVIGAGVTHTQITTAPLVTGGGTALAEGCGVIGGPQVRNVGTLAGNIAHALPAADGTIGLLALGGEAEVTGREEPGTASSLVSRWVRLEELFLGPGESAIDCTRELITRLRFVPTGPGEGSAFKRMMRPQGVALPMINMAVRLKLDEAGGRVRDARVTIGPAGPTPFLATETMGFLGGRPADSGTFAQAAEIALGEVHLRTSRHRATDEYRTEMIRALLPRTLAKAAERARTSQPVPAGSSLALD